MKMMPITMAKMLVLMGPCDEDVADDHGQNGVADEVPEENDGGTVGGGGDAHGCPEH